MPESSNSSLFPDVNVWVALSFEGHEHHASAREWFDSLSEENLRLYFCRITQLSLLRLLTTEAVMGADVLNQRQAWSVYDRWLEDSRVLFMDEPVALERSFRTFSRLLRPAATDWADAYLLAFAREAGLRIVTFDRSLAQRSESAVTLPL